MFSWIMLTTFPLVGSNFKRITYLLEICICPCQAQTIMGSFQCIWRWGTIWLGFLDVNNRNHFGYLSNKGISWKDASWNRKESWKTRLRQKGQDPNTRQLTLHGLELSVISDISTCATPLYLPKIISTVSHTVFLTFPKLNLWEKVSD